MTTVIWGGEEGISTGALSGSINEKNTKFTVRCVRNLGLANDAPIKEKPDDYIQASKNADGSYTFECTHINESALRYYTSRGLTMRMSVPPQTAFTRNSRPHPRTRHGHQERYRSKPSMMKSANMVLPYMQGIALTDTGFQARQNLL